MVLTLKELLFQAIDYAGLYPPAQLDLETTVRNYLRYRQGEESWILGRLVCPVNRLGEMREVLLREGADLEKVDFAVIGSSSTKENWKQSLGQDFEQIAASPDLQWDTYELKLPVGIGCETLCRDIKAHIKQLRLDNLSINIELPWDEQMLQNMAEIGGFEESFGCKARFAGVKPEDIPSSDQVAFFLSEVCELGIPFKLTAGLHHPIRRVDRDGLEHHGFLNVLIAGLLRDACDLSQQEMITVLDEKRPEAFLFSDEKIIYGEFEATLDNVLDFWRLFDGMGSCSIEEPLEGLEAMGLLGAGAR